MEKITEVELLKKIAKNPEPYLQVMVLVSIAKQIRDKVK